MATKKTKEVWYDNNGEERVSEFEALDLDVFDESRRLESLQGPTEGYRAAIDAMHEYLHRGDVEAPAPTEEVLELRVGAQYRTSEGIGRAYLTGHRCYPIDILGWYYTKNGVPISPESAPKILAEVRP